MSWTIVAGPRFDGDLADLPPKVRSRVEEFVLLSLPAIENPFALRNLAKLKGYQGFYKVQFGTYRLGLQLDGQRKIIHLLRVMHGRDIYRHFP